MTEREKVLLQREAAAKVLVMVTLWSDVNAKRRAAELFPLPKVTRPRVVRAGYSECRVVNGTVESRSALGCGDWSPAVTTVDELRALGSLPDNPTEEVEDEDE